MKVSHRSWLRRLARLAALLLLVFYAVCVSGLLLLRWVNPPTTALQAQRRIEAFLGRKKYTKRYSFVPLSRISRDLQHAVVAAEDGRFYQHHGIDLEELRIIAADNLKQGRLTRGGSTITQQLVKNLFLTTYGSFARKAAEFTLAPVAELLLSKQRILELYLNVIEWGPGIYGAEQAARRYYRVSASRLDREQAARLAAIIPSPRRWTPAHMDEYAAAILERMSRTGW